MAGDIRVRDARLSIEGVSDGSMVARNRPSTKYRKYCTPEGDQLDLDLSSIRVPPLL